MKESVKNSHQKTVVPDEIYKMFDVVFTGVEKNLAKTMEEILEKPTVALHLKNVSSKIGGVWSSESKGVIRIELNSVDGFMWGRKSSNVCSDSRPQECE